MRMLPSSSRRHAAMLTFRACLLLLPQATPCALLSAPLSLGLHLMAAKRTCLLPQATSCGTSSCR